MKLKHIAIEVSNLRASVRLYKSLFGFEPIYTQRYNRTYFDSDFTVIKLKKDNVVIELIKNNEFQEVDTSTTLNHICFEVDNIKQVYQKCKRRSLGIEHYLQRSQERTHVVFFFRDYDWNIIEVSQRVSASQKRK